MEWSTACPDWEKKIVACESISPCDPLFPKVADIAEKVFKSLILVDVMGQPEIGEVTREWVFDFVRAIFGAQDPVSKKRLIKEFLLIISKKNTKSTIAAGIMMTAAVLNTRHSAELVILAPTKEVADNSFIPLRDFIKADDELSERFSVSEHTKTITDRSNDTKIKVIAADANSAAGKKASIILIDEIWLFGKKSGADSMFREAKGGLTSRPEGCVIYLSTMSDDVPTGVFKTILDYGRDVRDGIIKDPTFYPMIFEFPKSMIEKGDHLNPDNWYITNPNLGLSVDADYLLAEFLKVRENKTQLADFMAKHLNIEIGMNLRANRWAGAEFWDQNIETGLTLDEIIERSDLLTIGGDGGGLDDLLGLAVVGRDKEDPLKWYAWCHACCHEIALSRRKKEEQRLRKFEADGDLTIYKKMGDDIHVISEIINKVDASGKLAQIGLDPMMLGSINDAMEACGVDPEKIYEVKQGYLLMGYIMTTERKLSSSKLVHCGQDMMTWCVGNAKVVMIGNGYRITKQESGVGKIDPLIALFNAVALMSSNPEPVKKEYNIYFF